MLLGYKIAAGVTIAGLLACAVLYGLWQHERAERKSVEAKAKVLEIAYNQEKETNNSLIELTKASNANVNNLINKYDQVTSEVSQQTAEINALRNTELKRTLDAPFERGQASTERKRKILRQFEGRKDE